MGLIEQRRFERLPTEIEVTFRHGHETYSEYTLNISAGGLFIKTVYPRQMGDVIEMAFTLPNQKHNLDMKGIVRWSNSMEGQGPVGMGVEFTDMDELQKKAILQFIVDSQLTQPGY